ncbi:MAG: hypothetical protein HQ512_07980 [Rhodospirillales bacterium]|nr:hypothetical protein [Rhodospirillales bacterium]
MAAIGVQARENNSSAKAPGTKYGTKYGKRYFNRKGRVPFNVGSHLFAEVITQPGLEGDGELAQVTWF